MRGGAFLKGKEGRVGFRKNSLWLKILQMSAMKVCFQIAECSKSYLKGDGGIRKSPSLTVRNLISKAILQESETSSYIIHSTINLY